MTDKEHVKRVTDLAWELGEAMTEAREAGLGIKISDSDSGGVTLLSVEMWRMTPLYSLRDKIDIARDP